MPESHARRMPTFFIPHGGGPCFFMDWPPPMTHAWDSLAAFLRGLMGSLERKPRAILVVSAHWETPVPSVTAGSHPPLIFDYSGFPPHTYQLKYPAPGSPELAARVRELLEAAGIPSAADSARGFDHGVFIPFLLIEPAADVPIVEMSLAANLDPKLHLEIGRALAPLRDEGVLIVGSGMSYHNLATLRTGRDAGDSERFDAWLTESVGSRFRYAPEAARGLELSSRRTPRASRRRASASAHGGRRRGRQRSRKARLPRPRGSRALRLSFRLTAVRTVRGGCATLCAGG